MTEPIHGDAQEKRFTRNTNEFFTYSTNSGKVRFNLRLTEISRIVYYYITAFQLKLNSPEKILGCIREALVDWHLLTSEVCR